MKYRLMIVVAALMFVAACMSAQALTLENIPGTFSAQLGMSMAQVQTWDSDGPSSGESKTSANWALDYKYPIGEHFRVGVSIFNWSFGAIDSSDSSHGGTSFCGQLGYKMGKSSELFLGVGQIVRMGYRSYLGESKEQEKGMFVSGEFDAPINDDKVDSFANVSVGFSF